MKKAIINSLPISGTNSQVKVIDMVGYTQVGGLASQEHSLFDHLAIPHNKIDNVVKNLFGKGSQGQIDLWKEDISSTLNTDINEEMGDVIAHWGYTL
jgi:hypothetical protein